MSMLPRVENSIRPGRVRSSRLPVGISVTSPMNGICGTGGMEVWPGGVLHLFLIEGTETVLSPGADNWGNDGECWRLRLDSASVASVVPLSRAVELDGASPESLRSSSRRFDLAVPDSHC